MSLPEKLYLFKQHLTLAMDMLESAIDIIYKSEISASFIVQANIETEYATKKQTYDYLKQLFANSFQEFELFLDEKLVLIKNRTDDLKFYISTKLDEFDINLNLLNRTYEVYTQNLQKFCDTSCMFCDSIPSIFVNASKYHRVCLAHKHAKSNQLLCKYCSSEVPITYMCSFCGIITQDLQTLSCKHSLCTQHINSHSSVECSLSNKNSSNINKTLDPPTSNRNIKNKKLL